MKIDLKSIVIGAGAAYVAFALWALYKFEQSKKPISNAERKAKRKKQARQIALRE